ncbi:MAG: UDP-N-acetylmuramate dehydrogenase [Acidimicrobiales bacterium]|jgi:UDP-N-acetylmuramate dehydrogenase|nr:UDP-N-acetylmuramate dehydrogenase [Acidimicrobiales bacterium]
MPEPGLAALDDALQDADLVDGIRVDYPVGGLTTYRVGGRAARFVRPADTAELERVAQAVAAAADTGAVVPVLIVGRGSNLLVSDRGFGGLAIQLGMGFEEVSIDGGVVLAGGAASLPVVARLTVAAGLEGFEWAVGVPGSIGGAVRMNAGGHGSDMAAVLVSATTVELETGAVCTRSVEDLALGYRTSTVTSTEVVVTAELRLATGKRTRGEEKLAEVVRWRRANQPGGQNAGSVFTNPPGDSAGRLVDAAGGRGLRIGSAEVSTRHANFIQADEGGSAEDVARLMAELVRLVEEVHGVLLEPETILVGF